MGSVYSLTIEIGGFFRENPQSETKFIFKTAILAAWPVLTWVSASKFQRDYIGLIENQTVITEE